MASSSSSQAKKVSELRENIGGIERGNLLYQRRDGGRDPDSRQRQQQADGAVCEDHQQHRHQSLRHMEHPGEKADGAAQNIGDQKCQHKGHQQRQRILQQQITQRQHQRQIGHINDELFLFFCGHQKPPIQQAASPDACGVVQ